MKLASSTGDFKFYVPDTEGTIKAFKGLPFKYINLEQTQREEDLFSDNDGYKKLADAWGNAAAQAGVTFVLSHAPCLHNPVMEALSDHNDETYQRNVLAICNSINICKILGIKRIVVHACSKKGLDKDTFYRYNKMFYDDLLPVAEKCGVMLLTENWDSFEYGFSTGKDLADFIDCMDHPLLAACWDTAHGNIDKNAREIGQYENIMTLGNRLKALHISDNFGDSHHHSWPFAGIINFDSIMQGLIDVNYDGYFNFEASYTLLHQFNMPYNRQGWEYKGEKVTKLLSPSIELKKKAVELLYETGKYILEQYDCFEA